MFLSCLVAEWFYSWITEYHLSVVNKTTQYFISDIRVGNVQVYRDIHGVQAESKTVALIENDRFQSKLESNYPSEKILTNFSN